MGSDFFSLPLQLPNSNTTRTDDGKAKALVDRALRLLRPAGDVNEHAPAVKQRLRRSILDTSGSDGPNDGTVNIN